MANIWTKEQQEAIDKEGSNIIVSAGAGSGKTAVLTERVIRKLKNGVSINNLLILTFTNMAAKEMKERIRSAIKNESKLSDQLNLIDSAYITTFDSYALSLVKKYNYLLNVSPNVNISESSIIILEKSRILDDIFDELYENNNNLFIKMINDFCVKDDKDIKKYILNINNKLDMNYNRQTFLKNYLDNYYNDDNLNNLINEYNNLLISILNDIKEDIYNLSFYIDADYIDNINKILNNLLNSKNYDEIKNNLSIKLPNLPKNSLENAKLIKKGISDKIKKINEYCVYKDTNEIKQSIENAKDYVEIIIDILLKLDEHISKYKEEKELYEFIDIAKLAIKLVTENKEVQDELKNTYNEIMVDEYQDTNDLQELFISNIANNNVYMVGDIKQSIYKFRNANVYIFKNKYDEYSKNINGIKIDLTKNFRSREEVINNINLVFNHIMNDKNGGANYIESHQMIFGNNDYNLFNSKQNNDLEILNYDYEAGIYSKEEIEIFTIAKDINDKIKNGYLVFDKKDKVLRKCRYNDFCILIDRLTTSDLYQKIFNYYNIPLVIYKDKIITNSINFSIIKNIINLIIKIKDNNYDNDFKHSFMSIGRSFLFEYDDNYLFDIITNNKYKDTELYNIIKNIANIVDYSSISDILNEIITELNIYEKYIKIGNIKENITDLDYFINLTNNLSNIGYNLIDFNNYLNDINKNELEIKYSINNLNDDAVRLMTIHKSKGLEYNICYYSMLFKEFNFSDLKEKILYDNKYGIVTSYFNEGINDTIVKDLVKENYYNEEISERIRLLYVAMTRSKEKMIVLINNIHDNINIIKCRSFKDLFLKVVSDMDKYITNINIKDLKLTKEYNNINKKEITNSNNKKLVIDELSINSSLIDESSYSKKTNEIKSINEKRLLEYGEYLHYVLEVIDFNNYNLDFITDKKIKDKILAFLNCDLLNNNANKKIYKEYEFIYEEDNNKRHGIIDLMLEYDNYIDIIDYKLKNIDDENYIKQLNGYQRYIEKVSNKKTNIYLYSLMDEKYKKL